MERLAGARQAGDEDQKSYFRRGKLGEWRNRVEADVLAAFRERHGDLVTLLGYKSEAGWALD